MLGKLLLRIAAAPVVAEQRKAPAWRAGCRRYHQLPLDGRI